MRIRTMTQDDIPAAADVAFASFRKDELMNWLYPDLNRHPDVLRHRELLLVRRALADRGTACLVAETEDGDGAWAGRPEVVGVAVWKRRGEDEEAAKWYGADSVGKRIERMLLACEDAYYSRFFDPVDRKRLAAFSSQTAYPFFDTLRKTGHFHLALLAVHPRFGRQGIEARLVGWGMAAAAKESTPVTVKTTKRGPGRGLYDRLGFVVVDEVTVGPGLEGVAMLWEPRGTAVLVGKHKHGGG